jgi:hypothetical protein
MNSFYNSEEYFNYQRYSSENWEKIVSILLLLDIVMSVVLGVLLIALFYLMLRLSQYCVYYVR